MTRIGGAHHVLGVKGLLGELWDTEHSEFTRRVGRQGCESNQEEVETRKGHHVHGELAEIAVELSREAERAGGSSDGVGDEVVEVRVAGVGKLERAEADVVERLVV